MTASLPGDEAPDLVLGLVRPYLPVIIGSAIVGAIGGLSVAGLLAVVNNGLHASSQESGRLLFAFVGLCLLALVGSIGADIGANMVGQKVVAVLRKALADRILAAPIDALEAYRPHRLIPVLTHDVDTISDFAFMLSTLAVALTVTLGCFVYLAILSPAMFAVVALAAIGGVVVQAYAQMRGVQGFLAARDGEDRLQKCYQAIAQGAKELRLHRGRRRRSASALRDTIDEIRDKQIGAIALFVTARGCGTILFFAVVGLTLALRQLVWPGMEATKASGFVLVLLYMRGPVDQVISTLPTLSRTLVAVRRVTDLGRRFATSEPGLASTLEADTSEPGTSEIDTTTADGAATIRSIALCAATYAFPTTGDVAPFVLGPIDFEIRTGEIVFIVGENGSGKTTLIKLLLALYAPTSGTLVLDGKEVRPDSRDAYRQLFTTIFSDYYLFEDIVGATEIVPAEAERYLERLEVARKVTVRDGSFSTIDLSTGQRKRLALLNAWIEKRPVLVFDEWAADQDPTFRRIFYEELLPDLKRIGKTIVVISHDDRYFGAADRIVRLADGRVVAEPEPRREVGELAHHGLE